MQIFKKVKVIGDLEDDAETFFWKAVNDGGLKVKCWFGHKAGGEAVSHLKTTLSANHLELAKFRSGRQFWEWLLLYHFCWDHGVLDLRAWEEVSHQEVTACFSQLAGFFTCSKWHKRHWSEYLEFLAFKCTVSKSLGDPTILKRGPNFEQKGDPEFNFFRIVPKGQIG